MKTPNWRTRIGLLLHKRPWIMPTATLISCVALGSCILFRATLFATFGAAGGVGVTAFVWGYAQRARLNRPWPTLSHLKRRQYRETWDAMASSTEDAMLAVAGSATDSSLRASARKPIGDLVEFAGVSSTDDVLEIACGVGRIGRELAPRCRSWVGADISGNMLAQATQRLSHLPNTRLHQLDGHGLRGIADSSFDVVYCLNAIAHIDDYDRWRYVEDAFRVLRSGGRLLIDNIDLNSNAGWKAFLDLWSRFEEHEPPPYIPRFSTADELIRYFTRAGFVKVAAHSREPLVIVTGIRGGE